MIKNRLAFLETGSYNTFYILSYRLKNKSHEEDMIVCHTAYHREGSQRLEASHMQTDDYRLGALPVNQQYSAA